MSYLNLGYLKLDLFCRGAKIGEGCDFDNDTRPIKRTRGGLGSGLDAILPNDVWVNIPVVEPFAQKSPYEIVKRSNRYLLLKEGQVICELKLPPHPLWYKNKTSSYKSIGDIGVMQGTYFSVYPSELCNFWKMKPKRNCRFCSVGLCLGVTESEEKSVKDVVEAVVEARKNERITFVHFNTGYIENDRALDIVMPYVEAVKKKTGLLIGVQCPPALDLSKYDRLKRMGVNHVSFCFELFDPERFEKICPGKAEFFGRMANSITSDPLLEQARTLAKAHLKDKEPHHGQLMFYRAILYCVKLFGKGRVAGEIISGLEPPNRSIQAIEFLAELGAVSTVCVFRPCIGTDLENEPPPNAADLAPVFARMYEVCIEKNIPIGIAPNIKTAMVHLPEEGRWLSDKSYGFKRVRYEILRSLMKASFKALFAINRIGK